jgi:hypothetical protein
MAMLTGKGEGGKGGGSRLLLSVSISPKGERIEESNVRKSTTLHTQDAGRRTYKRRLSRQGGGGCHHERKAGYHRGGEIDETTPVILFDL